MDSQRLPIIKTEKRAFPWNSMELHRNYSFPWNSISHQTRQNSIEFHGIPCPNPRQNSMEFYGFKFMEFHGNTWEMFHGIPWNSMSQYQTEFHGKSSMEPHGIPWNSMGLFHTGRMNVGFATLSEVLKEVESLSNGWRINLNWFRLLPESINDLSFVLKTVFLSCRNRLITLSLNFCSTFARQHFDICLTIVGQKSKPFTSLY